MKIIKTKNYQELSKKVAEIISEQIKVNPKSVLGLATGSTPVGAYKELIKSNLDFSEVRSINLDEYVGLDGSNEQSYRYFMEKNLFEHINIKKENTYVPNGKGENLQKECEGYEEKLSELGGVDLQLLGIGLNGHIGFNEPDKIFGKNTHVVDLDESTLEANARFFDSIEEVPKQAITMGIKSIMQAKKILLVVNIPEKIKILEKAIYGDITPEVPASVLQLHQDVIVVYCEE